MSEGTPKPFPELRKQAVVVLGEAFPEDVMLVAETINWEDLYAGLEAVGLRLSSEEVPRTIQAERVVKSAEEHLAEVDRVDYTIPRKKTKIL